ncbi:hypothetical protein AAFF_G00085110 [Aldrovandia affinis]|uniref:Reverse transcriptase RNase H-like domain-containing protein n=1 Tax=Aldrovandia affinis TaxID=143900 RepID=A0AAD7R3K3_9TELE|nr:hypothetical protein AAFF_G00085110 [Aldrovandia affinis]
MDLTSGFTMCLCMKTIRGVQTDPGKVEAIGQVQVSDLMDSDGVTPSQKKIRSFLAVHLGSGRLLDGIGAVISQLQPGEKIARPVAFASRTLSRAQLNYPAHRLEFLALKWAICDKFSHWLKGVHFTAWSDNNPLTYILTKPRWDACEQRWVAKLAAYDFDLKYVPGPKNTVADALSREPFVRSCVSHRLVKETYLSLLNEVNGVVTGMVQDAFRLTTNCQRLQTTGRSG